MRVARHYFACARCWRRLPSELRQMINNTPRRDHHRHALAMLRAQEWYRDNPPFSRAG